MKIGFVGAGHVGVSMGSYMSWRGLSLSGYYDTNVEAAQKGADLVGGVVFSSLSEMITSCEWIFITVPDDVIATVWTQCQQYDIRGKVFVHCSGAMSSDIFAGAVDSEAYVFSMHPIQAFPAVISTQFMERVFFTVEGMGPREMIEALFDMLGNGYKWIYPADKVRYHLAAVMLSNMVCALYSKGRGLLLQCGFSDEEVSRCFYSMFVDNAVNVASIGCREALTGPVERNDVGTIEKHLQILNGDDRELYRILSEELVKIAKEKRESCDYSSLYSLLQS